MASKRVTELHLAQGFYENLQVYALQLGPGVP